MKKYDWYINNLSLNQICNCDIQNTNMPSCNTWNIYSEFLCWTSGNHSCLFFFLTKNITGYLLQCILSYTMCSKEQGKRHNSTFLLYLYSSYIQNTHNAVNLEFHTFYNHWIRKTLGKRNMKVEKSTVKLWKEFWSRHQWHSWHPKWDKTPEQQM